MHVEFLGRFRREKTEDEKEQEYIQKLVNGADAEISEDTQYTYKSVVLDINKNNVKGFADLDNGEHTLVKTIAMDVYILKINFEVFKNIFSYVNVLTTVPSYEDFVSTEKLLIVKE